MRSDGMSVLCFDARLVCSASTAGSARLLELDPRGAEHAEPMAVRLLYRVIAAFRGLSTCTTACTGQRSINQRYSHAGTRWDTHSYLRLTCCVCRRIQICSGCSRGRSSFQPAFCSGSDGRSQWLHIAGMPGGRAHMPHMQLLRNERCSRKAAEPAISLPSTLQTLYRNQTNSCKHVHCFLKLQWSSETRVVNGPLAVLPCVCCVCLLLAIADKKLRAKK